MTVTSKACYSKFPTYRLLFFCLHLLAFASLVIVVTHVNLFMKGGFITTPKHLQLRLKELVITSQNASDHLEENGGLISRIVTLQLEELSDNFNSEYVYLDNINEHKDIQQKVYESVAIKETRLLSQPTILLWTTTPANFTIPESPVCGGGCRITQDRSEINGSDAIVFIMKMADAKDLPKSKWRRPDQAYVWWCEESAWTVKNFYEKNLTLFANDYFNWTMTYKKNSDVNAMMIPHEARDYIMERISDLQPERKSKYMKEKLPDERTPPPTRSENEIKWLQNKAFENFDRKKKMAAIVVSNCDYTAGAALRMGIVDELKRAGLEIDIYGKCGNESVPDDVEEFVQLLSQYRFYLAFENSHNCRDYISEKLWYNALYAGVLPVVWGPLKEDIEGLAPPMSFIYYEEYKSAEELVRYLLHLSVDSDLYVSYFAWWWELLGNYPIYGVTEIPYKIGNRKPIFDFETNAFCHLCKRLKDGANIKYKKSIRSLHDFWYDGETDICLDLYHKSKILQ